MNRPLRITIVQGAFLPVPPLRGGAIEKAFHALGREFAANGHTVTHVSRAYPGLPGEETADGVRHIRVRGHEAPLQLWKLKALDLFYSLRVRRVLPPADILVTHTFWMPVVERRASRGLPYVHVGRYPKGQLKFYPSRAILQTVSAPIRDAIAAEVPSRTDRVRVIPYPLAPAYLVPLNPSPSQTILYAGRIHPEKGIELLVEAFRLYCADTPDHGWRLKLVGPYAAEQGGGGDAYRDRLVRLAEGLPVEFTGPEFSAERLVATYRDAAIFAYPSIAERGETFGLAALEAMAAGAAPVVSGLACFRDFITPGQNGCSFDHRSPQAARSLCDELRSLSTDTAKLTSIRHAAWHTARAYTLAEVARTFIDDFSSALGAPTTGK